MKDALRFLICVPTAALILSVGLSGCAHERFVTDAEHPEIAVTADGRVTYRGDDVDPEDLPDFLEESGLTKRDTIHIRTESGLANYNKPYYVMGILVKSGFTRTVFVESRRSTSTVRPKAAKEPRSDSAGGKAPPAKRTKIRYKRP